MGKSYKVGLLLVVSMFLVSVIQPVAAQGSGSVSAPREAATCVEDCLNLPFACCSMPGRLRYYIPDLSQGLNNCIIDCLEIYVTFPLMFTVDIILTYLDPIITYPLTEFVGRSLIGMLYSLLAALEGPIVFLLETGLPLMLPLLPLLYYIPILGPGLRGTMEGFLYTGEGGARATYLLILGILGNLPDIIWRR